MNSSGRICGNDNRKLQSLGKSVSCDNLKANSCIELADIRKLDSLLNQCESISCDNLLLLDEIYNYDLCGANRRKYASMSAINKILPKNSIRRRAHKKILGIRESDTKIINFLDGVRNRTVSDSGTDANVTASPLDVAAISVEDEQMTPTVLDDRINCCDKNIQTSQINLNAIMLSPSVDTIPTNNKTHNVSTTTTTTTAVKCLCANDKSSPASKITSEKHVHDHHYPHSHHHYHHEKTSSSRKKEKRKQCSCRDYKNVNTASAICETSLSTMPMTSSLKAQVTNHQRKLKGREKSDEKSTSGKCNRLMKQKNTIIDDDDSSSGCGSDGIIEGCEIDNAGCENSSDDGCHENRVININKSVEIIPISLDSPYCSRPASPHLGTSTSLHHHDAKSDKSETQSQKSKRSKFSPSFISRKLTSRLNSSELEDGAGGAKESLLGRAKSTEKKLPDPVETVCIVISFKHSIYTL